MLTEKARTKADEAKKQGKWLYDPSYKNWYSPESFKHTFHYANATDEFVNQLQIKHPKEGIEAGFKRIEGIQKKLQNFIQTVTDYYSQQEKV